MVLALGAGCEKKKPNDTGAVGAADRASAPIDRTPLSGVDVSKLADDKQTLFYKLLGSLESPCGKGHSLRTSFATDQSCKRAPFAVKYVLAMIEDEIPEGTIDDAYKLKYASKDPPVKIDVSKAPRIGNDDAPVRFVELYDYGCHICQEFKPVAEQVIEQQGDKVVFYFLQFPLGNWPDSKSAAQAALAAAQQGKFKEMHSILFDRARNHNHDAVTGYAKELGLDMEKFEAAYQAAGPQVDADHAQGKTLGVESTPAIYFNNRRYDGPRTPKYIGMWIDEEIAVNR